MPLPDESEHTIRKDPGRVPLTPEQKWAEVNRLRRLAWDLKYASVKQCHPEWTGEQVRRRVRDIFLYATT